LGAITTFREAAKLLADLAGVHVGSETLRTQAERVGTELEGRQRRSMAHASRRASRRLTNMLPAPRLAGGRDRWGWSATAIGIWTAR
jgi:hypothetical protein